jgi:hypothetical protein
MRHIEFLPVVDYRLNQKGCFVVQRFWIQGWHRGLPYKKVEFVRGSSGRQTMVVIETPGRAAARRAN